MMATHKSSGNAVAIKFHKHEEARQHSYGMLQKLQGKYVAGLPNLKGDPHLFEDSDKFPGTYRD